MTEFEKMLSGQIYDSSDEYLVNLRNKANLLCTKYNQLSNYDNSLKAELLKKLIPNQKDNCYFQGPIHIDYGINMELGSNVYANYNFTCLDICKVTIKDNVMFGPNVTLAGALHPLNSEKRFIKENNRIHCMEYGGEIIINPITKSNTHPLKYFKHLPVESLSRFVANIFRSLSNIDE